MRQGLKFRLSLARTALVGAALITNLLPVVAAPAGPMTRIPGPESVIIEVQSRSCRACRNYCVRDFKWRCGNNESCRAGFTRCMRQCWEDVCR